MAEGVPQRRLSRSALTPPAPLTPPRPADEEEPTMHVQAYKPLYEAEYLALEARSPVRHE